MALESVASRVRRPFTAFGDDNLAAVRAQIRALRDDLSEDDCFRLYRSEHTRDAARDAVFWRDDDAECQSEGWEEIATPKESE